MTTELDDFKAPSEANTEPQSALHKAALELVDQGYRVIPIAPNGKTPILPDWHANAIETAEDADRFWTENPDANIAICPDDAGMAVIDVDPGASETDIAALKLPETYEVSTPRGGTHYYLAGSINPTVGKLAPHIDTRGRKSYVLVPPSIVGGKPYAVKQDRPIPMLPIAIEDRLRPRVSTITPVEDVDLAGARARATTRLQQMVKNGNVAIEGQGGDNLTYQTAVELVRDLGLPPEEAAQLMIEHWNPHCAPPWEPEEIAIKCVNAAEYGQNAIGARAVAPLATTFAGAIERVRSGELKVNTNDNVPAVASNNDDELLERAIDDEERELLRHLLNNPPDGISADECRQLLRRHFPLNPAVEAKRSPATFWDGDKLLPHNPTGTVGMVYGRKGVRKTSWLLNMLLKLVLNNPEMRVVYYLGEGGYEFGQSSIPGLCSYYDADVEALRTAKRFRQMPTILNFQSEDDLEFAIGLLKTTTKPNVIVIDTLTRATPGNINSSEIMTKAFAVAARLQSEFNAMVIVVHHEGKEDGRGSKGDTSFADNADFVLRLSKVNDGMVEVHVDHMRGASSDRSYGYRVSTGENGVQILKPVPDLELKSAVAIAKSKSKAKDGETDAERRAGIICDLLAEKRLYSIKHSWPTKRIAEHVYAIEHDGIVPRMAGYGGNDSQEEIDAYKDYEAAVERIANSIGATARAHVKKGEGAYASLCAFGRNQLVGRETLCWFIPCEEVEAANGLEELAGTANDNGEWKDTA